MQLTISAAQRGQMLVFYAFAMMACLALIFFLTNYASVVRWQIRAQNAADAAVTAGVATDANMHNQVTTELYALAVEEARIRYLNQALLNTINVPSTCGGSCAAYYGTLMTAYDTAVANYGALAAQLRKGNNLTEAGLQNAPDKAMKLVSSDANGLFDANFSYVTNSIDGAHETIDVTAWSCVPINVPGALGVNRKTFQAIGRSAGTVVPIYETFRPGTMPSANAPYQPDENPLGISSPPQAYAVSFKSLVVNLAWYAVGPTKPTTAVTAPTCS